MSPRVRGIPTIVAAVLIAGSTDGSHEHAILPGDHPDTGAEWHYSPSLDRRPFANGSNTRFAYAAPARGVGQAFDPTIRLG